MFSRSPAYSFGMEIEDEKLSFKDFPLSYLPRSQVARMCFIAFKNTMLELVVYKRLAANLIKTMCR